MKKLLFAIFLAWLAYSVMGCTPNNDDHIWTHKHKHCVVVWPNGVAWVCCEKEVIYPIPGIFHTDHVVFVLLAHGGTVSFNEGEVQFSWHEADAHEEYSEDVRRFRRANGKWVQD